MTVRLLADEHGRFGFNVKGGKDLGIPVQVSKVVPHTPADYCLPKIHEGDEVVMINGQSVQGLKHEQVVSKIRECRHTRDGELLLTIRSGTFNSAFNDKEEPLYQYVPENNDIGLHSHLGDNALFTQSLLLLSDGLASGSLLAQYELLYRKNADMTITEARKPENINKNRYCDISPYDCTRVTLVNSSTGDYINANYVNMEIPNGTINRFIATQGPLANTITDFWRMVQQESSHLVVMLTTVMEGGRQKCHQYWPVIGEKLQLGNGFSVKCLYEKPDETGSFVFREFLLYDKRTGELRHIQHMQYLAWPDHCVPSDPKLFLEFVERVRNARDRSLLHEIEESLKQVKLLDADADENVGLMSERKCANDVTPEDESPVPTSIHQ